MPTSARALGAVGVTAFALFVVYLGVGTRLASDVDLLSHSSGIYDMDVARVVVDLTQGSPGYRASAHPLQKLWLAPLGRGIDATFFGGSHGLRAAQVLVAIAAALAAFLTGWLALRLSDSAVAAVLACAIAGVSFTSVLSGAIPESAVFAGLTSLAPLILREARRDRAFTPGEAAAWGALLVLGLGLTLTQVLVVAIVAAWRLREALAAGGRRGVAIRSGVATLLAVVAVVAGVELQHRVESGTARFYTEDPIANESPFLRDAALTATPFRHVARLAAHFTVVDFIAPTPAMSDFLIRDYGLRSWSLSAEEAGVEHWRPAQRVLAIAWVVVLGGVVWCGRWRDPRLAAPASVLAFHFALHLLYGREYVLYAPHWHGVLTAVAVAAAWNGARPTARTKTVMGASLCVALLANSLFVMEAVRREVGFGLGVEMRDTEGRPLAERVVSP